MKVLGKPELVLISVFLELEAKEQDSRVEILSKAYWHLRPDDKQESLVRQKVASVMDSSENEDQESDCESDSGEPYVRLLTVIRRKL